ncbi:hypothetical protein [Jatrophihabitans sp.]|jgi:hypothetical protein|uniref:hypothetical protein n=1 Tax=Jatrophihabitans sp. TaxID=1932789 RepID=UPI002F1487D4
MPKIPTPIRAALGLAATAVDEARKLPETLPQAVTTVPVMAVSSAMQASLKVQQHIAMLAARGDEVLSQLRGSSAEPPSWATFDDDSPAGGNNGDAQPAKAAFDRIDYASTGFAEGAEGDEDRGRWDAVGAGAQPEPEAVLDSSLDSSLDAVLLLPDLTPADDESDVTATPPSAAGPTPPAPGLAEAVSAPDLPPNPAQADRAPSTPAKAGAKKAGPVKSGPAKVSPAKDGPAKDAAKKAGPAKSSPAGPAKAGPAKSSPAKAGPEKAAKRAGRKAPDHEPLEEAARKAKPSPVPNPSTMAAEILQAHEAAADDE